MRSFNGGECRAAARVRPKGRPYLVPVWPRAAAPAAGQPPHLGAVI